MTDDSAAIEELVDQHHAELSAWERSFLESVQEQLDDGRPLSDDQAEKLHEVAETYGVWN